MQDEYLLVQDLLKKHNISVSALADRVGMADSTMYEYTGGRRKNIPICVWRALFELTEDVRILDLVVGNVEIFVAPMPKPTGQECTEDTLKRLIEKRKKDIECETAILDILADGRIDQEDWRAIEQYREAHPDALMLDAQIYQTIMTRYEESLRREQS
ncbi:MAG: hypothetical protein JW828_07965 [Sedimentisphaerales bacterium]|nr:hypothetical protein [Sedimentisphaerales bacterium]